MKQSGARSAQGIFGVFGVKKQQNHREMKQSGARSAPGFFGVSGVRSSKNHRRMKQSGARSAPGDFLGYLVSKAAKTIGK